MPTLAIGGLAVAETSAFDDNPSIVQYWMVLLLLPDVIPPKKLTTPEVGVLPALNLVESVVYKMLLYWASF